MSTSQSQGNSPAPAGQQSSVPPDSPSLNVLYEMARDRVNAQLANAAALDAKAGFVLGSATLLTGVLVAWHAPGTVPSYPGVHAALVLALPYIVQLLPLIGIASYALVVFTAYQGYRMRRFYDVANLRGTVENYKSKSEAETKGTLLYTLLATFDRNVGILDQKTRWTRLAQAALGIEVGMVALMLLAQYLL